MWYIKDESSPPFLPPCGGFVKKRGRFVARLAESRLGVCLSGKFWLILCLWLLLGGATIIGLWWGIDESIGAIGAVIIVLFAAGSIRKRSKMICRESWERYQRELVARSTCASSR